MVDPRVEITRRSTGGGNQEKMAAFIAGVLVPVAKEQLGKNFGLHQGIGLLPVPLPVAGIGFFRLSDAVGIDGGGKENVSSVGRPDSAIGSARKMGEAVRFGDRAAAGVKGGEVDLRNTIASADEQDLLPVR